MKTFIAALMFVSTSAIAAVPECPMEIIDQKNCAPWREQHGSDNQSTTVGSVHSTRTPSVHDVAHTPPPSPPPSHPTQSCQKNHR